METVTITKEEFKRFKELEEIDFDLIRQFASSLKDLKQGRFSSLCQGCFSFPKVLKNVVQPTIEDTAICSFLSFPPR